MAALSEMNWRPHDRALRLLPRHGRPECKLEWLSQKAVVALAWAPLYTAVVVTLTLIVFLVWGI